MPFGANQPPQGAPGDAATEQTKRTIADGFRKGDLEHSGPGAGRAQSGLQRRF